MQIESCKQLYEIYLNIAQTYRTASDGDYASEIFRQKRKKETVTKHITVKLNSTDILLVKCI